MKADELYEGLTDKQRRRTELRAKGLLHKEIMAIEGVYQRAIQVSLMGAEKKMRENIEKHKKKH